MKCELIEERAGEVFSEYTLGPNSSTSAAVRTCPILQDQGVQAALHRRRVLEGQREEQTVAAHLRHGVFTQKELDEYLNRLEEAKRRDHRKLGRELELFTVSESVGAGCALVA